MKIAYVDTSCLVAIGFGEPAAERISRRLASFDRLLSSNLLEAELRATFAREEVRQASATELLRMMTWVLPNRPLTAEFERVLAVGMLKGTDLWHLACALFLDPRAEEMSFLSLDRAQARIAAKLGFRSKVPL